MKRNYFVIFLLFIAITISSFAQKSKKAKNKEPEYKSLLWEISGNGLNKPSYLYGTMHVSSKVAFHLADSFYICLNNVDAIGLETSPDIWLEGMTKENSIYRYGTEEVYLREDQFYQKAFTMNHLNKNDIEKLIYQDSELMNFLLYRSSGGSGNYEEDTYLDFFIYQYGKKKYKPVYSLEDFDISEKMTTKAEYADRSIPKHLRKSKPYIQNYYQKIEDAYKEGNLNLLDSLLRVRSTNSNYQKWMIDERNIVMANSIDSIIKNQSMFSGIGAAHLPGEAGVIEILRRKGYTLNPIKFNDIKESKYKKEIEDTNIPVTFKDTTSIDKYFSVSIPNTLYLVQNTNEHQLYIAPDLANGCYYMIKKHPHDGKLLGKDKAYMISKIDSLLYENIPGKIIERKYLKDKNNNEIIDIINQTRRGDFHRVRFIVDEQFVFQLVMHGNKDYINKYDHAEKFINSFEIIKENSTGFEIKKPYYGGYECKLPNKSLYCKETPYGISDFNEYWMGAYDGDQYILKKRSLIDFSYFESDTFELNIIAENVVASCEYELTKIEIIVHNGYPAVLFSGKSKKDKLYIHGLILTQGQYYYLVAHYGKTSKPNKEVLLSFKILSNNFVDTNYDTVYSENLFYKTIAFDEPKNYTSASIYRSYNNYYYDDNYENYEAFVMPSSIYNPHTAEMVNITLTKFHKYYYKTAVDSFWKARFEVISTDRDLKLKKSNYYQKGNRWYADATVSSDKSIKVMQFHFILDHGSLYTIGVLSDSITPLSNFYLNAIAGFDITDTIFENNLFKDKLPDYISDIYSEDSLTKKIAEDCSDYFALKFDSTNKEIIKKLFSNPKFENLKNSIKIDLVEKLYYYNDSTLFPLLEKIYNRNDDSSSLQFSILKTLAKQQTSKSYETISKLLSTNAAIGNSNNDTYYLFSKMDDSIELCKPIIEEIIDLISIPEYEEEAIALLTKLNYLNYLDINQKLKLKKIFQNKCNLEIKRKKAELASQKNRHYSSYNYSNYSYDLKSFLRDGEPKTNNKDYNLSIAFDNKLFNYLNVLVEYYNEQEIKSLFNKILAMNDGLLQLTTSSLLLQKNYTVNDTIWEHYASKDETRLLVYCLLKEANQLDKFPKKYLNQEKMSLAYLYVAANESTDKIELYKKTVYNDSIFYVFKIVDEDEEVSIEVIGPQPKDASKINFKDLFTDKEKNFELNSELSNEIEKSIRNILYRYRVKDRERAPENNYEVMNDYAKNRNRRR